MRVLRKAAAVYARADAIYCAPACRAAAARWHRRFLDFVDAHAAIRRGKKADVARRCPQCGRWFAPGFGHRRD